MTALVEVLREAFPEWDTMTAQERASRWSQVMAVWREEIPQTEDDVRDAHAACREWKRQMGRE